MSESTRCHLSVTTTHVYGIQRTYMIIRNSPGNVTKKPGNLLFIFMQIFVTKQVEFRIIQYKPNQTTMMKFTTIGKAKKLTGLSYVGNINSSAKLGHSQEFSQQYTYAIYLAPAKTSGYNTCAYSTPECRMGCLNTSGRAGIEEFSGLCGIKNARIKKTRLLFEETAFFMDWMIAEIKSARAKAQRDGFFFSVRLNATSDIDWSKIYVDGKNIYQIFPDVAFYDYTKNHTKFEGKASNYHLTYSYTGRNWDLCKALLKQGYNVAMVFNVKDESLLPKTYEGYNVINGDLTDYRIDDACGIIVGLKWKRIANRVNEKKVLQSCFVVTPSNVQAVNVRELQLA